MSDEPTNRRWLAACDESGMDGAQYYGFGSLWLSWDRRGDLSAGFQELRDLHGYASECKWKKAGSKKYAAYFDDLIDYFFARRWLAFHCLIVRKALVDRDLHGGDLEIAKRKHLTMLLTNKMKLALRASPKAAHRFHVWVDRLPYRYRKAHEAVEVISNHVLNRELKDRRAETSVVERDSKETEAIQLCDLLLGCVMAAWQGKAFSEGKQRVIARVADHLGWPDLRADTPPGQRKFNVWYFYPDPEVPREVATRPVIFK